MSDWSYRKGMPREEAHNLKYGTTDTPPRGTGRGWITSKTVENLSTTSKVIALLAAAGGLYLLWKNR